MNPFSPVRQTTTTPVSPQSDTITFRNASGSVDIPATPRAIDGLVTLGLAGIGAWFGFKIVEAITRPPVYLIQVLPYQSPYPSHW